MPEHPERIGKFEVKAKIGEGGMGVVYKAYDPLMHRHVAIKTFTAELDVEAEVRSRFMREAIAVGRLTHPNIVTVHDVFEDGDKTFMVMEYLEGQNLGRAMRTRALKTLEDQLWVVGEVCKGLTFAHSMGVVHRDIKPANVFLTARGDVKILDFGIARIASTTVSKSVAGIMGTPYYMSPEQWSGGQVDHRADIFALGVMLYEMLTGKKPFESHNSQAVAFQVINSEPTPIHELNTTVPDQLVDIVKKSLAKRPEERFDDVQEIQEGLSDVTDGLSSPSLDLEETHAVDSTPHAWQPKTMSRTPRTPRTPKTPRSRPSSPSHAASSQTQETTSTEATKRWIWLALPALMAIAAAGGWFFARGGTSGEVENDAPTALTTTSAADAVTTTSTAAPAAPPPLPTTTPTTIATSSTTSIVAAARTTPAPPTASTGTLDVRSTPGAEITVDGRAMGTAPTRLFLQPGTHRVRLSSGGTTWEDVVTVALGRTTTLERPLDRMGALAVNSEIWATIRLDGGEAFETPHFFQRVPVGAHTLHVSRDGYASQRIDVTIEEGATVQLALEMRRAP